MLYELYDKICIDRILSILNKKYVILDKILSI